MDDPLPQYFESPLALRRWLRQNHATARVLVVEFYKKHVVKAGKPCITWPESVAEALCFGWIDGVRRSLDADRYTVRFTPRRPGSTWSAVNIRLMAELEAAGKMTDAGRAAFAARTEARSRVYTYEQTTANPVLGDASEREFKKNKSAWEFFQAQPPGYRRKVILWILSAKKDDARERRFRKLLAACASRKRVE